MLETHKKARTYREIRKSLRDIEQSLLMNVIPHRACLCPYSVSFDIPDTQNEAALHIVPLGDNAVTLRLDVRRKGTGRIYSHYLKSYSYSAIAICIRKDFICKEIYNSVIFLSGNADEHREKAI